MPPDFGVVLYSHSYAMLYSSILLVMDFWAVSQFGVRMNKAAVNIFVQVFLWIYIFVFPG
jgi:hypothetical protein